MLIPVRQVEKFKAFATRLFGGRWIEHVERKDTRCNELARSMLSERFVWLRKVEDAEFVEVCCSDKDFLKSLSDQWDVLLMSEIDKEIDDGQS